MYYTPTCVKSKISDDIDLARVNNELRSIFLRIVIRHCGKQRFFNKYHHSQHGNYFMLSRKVVLLFTKYHFGTYNVLIVLS